MFSGIPDWRYLEMPARIVREPGRLAVWWTGAPKCKTVKKPKTMPLSRDTIPEWQS